MHILKKCGVVFTGIAKTKRHVKKLYTNGICVERRLVSGQRGEIGGHAGGCGGGRVRVRRAVHRQRHAGGQPLVVEELVLARADRLAGYRVLEDGAAGVAAARRGRGGRAGSRRAARAARAAAHPGRRRWRTVGGCRYGAL